MTNNRVAITIRNWDTTGTCTPLAGSTMRAKPRPIPFAMDSPATTSAWNTICTMKPMARPIITCCNTIIRPS